MKTFLANAFAVVRLQTVQEFHLCRLNTNAPDCPYLSLRRFPKTNKIETTSYSIIPCTNIQACKACFEHSNFFKVNLAASQDTRLRAPWNLRHTIHGPMGQKRQTANRPLPCRDPTTSFLTATTLIYAIGAGITAAAGTRLALQWFLVKGFKVYSFRLPGLG